MIRSSGPSQSRIRERELRHMLTAILTLCGQVSGEPSGVADQSLARMRAPISPPPASQPEFSASPFLIDALPELRGRALGNTAAPCAARGREGTNDTLKRDRRRASETSVEFSYWREGLALTKARQPMAVDG